MSKNKKVMNMSAEEVAEMITDLFSPYLRYKLLEEVLKTVRVPDIADEKISVHSIRTALQRHRVGDELSRKIFLSIAKRFPHVLEYALEKELNELAEKYRVLKEKVILIKEESISRS